MAKEQDDENAKDKGGGGGMMGGMLSDKHSKDEIKRLEGANDALRPCALIACRVSRHSTANGSGGRSRGRQHALDRIPVDARQHSVRTSPASPVAAKLALRTR